MDVLAGLLPPLVAAAFFIALLVTALRATDRPKRSAPRADRRVRGRRPRVGSRPASDVHAADDGQGAGQ